MSGPLRLMERRVDQAAEAEEEGDENNGHVEALHLFAQYVAPYVEGDMPIVGEEEGMRADGRRGIEDHSSH